MIYEWKYNMPIKAQVVGEHFERLEKQQGHITPKIVLESARSETSAIHPCFEWNDDVAAEKYRETQAGLLIRNLTVKMIETGEKQTEPVRAYVSIKQSDSSEFISLQNVLKDDELTQKMLEQAKNELNAFAKKYSALQELSKVFEAIAEVNGK